MHHPVVPTNVAMSDASMPLVDFTNLRIKESLPKRPAGAVDDPSAGVELG